ncbi:unnamed protein product [Amoebophrya sp. A120]|nr:unnamed protein product [Amoebophrya sp. A120]|eukprot:GSA120T00017832001.1
MGLCLFREEENDARILKISSLKKQFAIVLGNRENLNQECQFLWAQILRSTGAQTASADSFIDKGDVMSCTQKFIDQIDGGDEESLAAIDLLINQLENAIYFDKFLLYVRDIMLILDKELQRRYEHALDAHGSLCTPAYQEAPDSPAQHYCYNARDLKRAPFHATNFVPAGGVGGVVGTAPNPVRFGASQQGFGVHKSTLAPVPEGVEATASPMKGSPYFVQPAYVMQQQQQQRPGTMPPSHPPPDAGTANFTVIPGSQSQQTARTESASLTGTFDSLPDARIFPIRGDLYPPEVTPSKPSKVASGFENVEQVRDALLAEGVLMQVFNSEFLLEWKYIKFSRTAANAAPNQIQLLAPQQSNVNVMTFELNDLERVERGPQCLALGDEIAEAATQHVSDASSRMAAFIFGGDGFLILVFPDASLGDLCFKAFKTFGLQVG